MTTRNAVLYLWFSLVLLMISSVTAAAEVSLEKVLPFAASDEVRIAVEILTPAGESFLDLHAKISSCDDDSMLWSGYLGRALISGATTTQFSSRVTHLNPNLWTPSTPHLYRLNVRATRDEQTLAETKIRFGFRSFENHQGQFMLNGKPIYLRGVAINPPGRGIPEQVGFSREFAEDYIRFLKSHNVNIIRLHRTSQDWFDLCDELGMMIFQGCYGSPPGGKKTELPKDMDRTIELYKSRYFEEYVRHPSIIIYTLANELPYFGSLAEPYEAFVREAWLRLREWDPNRLYITNAGYGNGKSGEIFDFHRYWGWYYGSFLTYHVLRDYEPYKALREHPDDNPQPMTMTECVGCYNMPNGRFNLVFRQRASALGWTGYTENQPQADLEYHALSLKNSVELFRRLRKYNPKLAGIMPFTILFDRWSNISCFEDMSPKLAMKQMQISYQPVLLSWELWTPNVYSGSTILPIAHLVNDSVDFEDFPASVLEYALVASDGTMALSQRSALPSVPYSECRSAPVSIKLPAALSSGEYTLQGRVLVNGVVRSSNETHLYVQHTSKAAKSSSKSNRPTFIFDGAGETRDALRSLGFNVSVADDIRTIAADGCLIIGEDAFDASLSAASETLKNFVQAGGRVLVLRHEDWRGVASWLPLKFRALTASPIDVAYPQRHRPFVLGSFINPLRPNNPCFDGVPRERLTLWSDYTNWDESKTDFPRVFPVNAGFEIPAQEDLGCTAVLANYDNDLRGVALCEIFDGKGSVILCAFDLIRRCGLDPVAERLLVNVVEYAASQDVHEHAPRITEPIVWADFSTEKGVISGTHNGFLEEVVQVDPATDAILARNQNRAYGWNDDPGRLFRLRGRKPVGTGASLSSELFGADLTERSLGYARFFINVPGDRRMLSTLVENPSSERVPFQVNLNGIPTEGVWLEPEQMTEVTCSLPLAAEYLEIGYVSTVETVVLETRI